MRALIGPFARGIGPRLVEVCASWPDMRVVGKDVLCRRTRIGSGNQRS